MGSRNRVFTSESGWDLAATDWTQLEEPKLRPLYDVILKALGPASGMQLLDAGCASGVFCALAATKGIVATGVDSSRAMISIARDRTPPVNAVIGDIQKLPFDARSFDIVTALNTLFHCPSPSLALAQFHRVLKPGGRLVLASWSDARECQAASVAHALMPLLPPTARRIQHAIQPSAITQLRQLAVREGFTKLLQAKAATMWDYPDQESALRGLLAHGVAKEAIRYSGLARAEKAAAEAIKPFRTPTGRIRMINHLDYCVLRLH